MTKENRKIKKRHMFPRVLIIFSLFIALYFALMLFKQPMRTETVQSGTMENKVKVSGYILYNENVVNSQSDGMLSCIAHEGARVSAYSKIASVVKGEVDETLWGKLNQINAEIAELEKTNVQKSLIISDEASADSVMESTIEAMIDSVYDNNMTQISQYKDEIQRVIQYKNGNDNSASSTGKLDALKAEKSQLEQSAGGEREDIYAPVSGVFSSKIDGYEGTVDLNKLSEINADTLKKLDEIKKKEQNHAVAGEPVVKIMDNYKWYFVTSVETRWLSGLKEGSYLEIAFSENAEENIEVKVEKINESENETAVIVLSSTKKFSDVYQKRKTDAEIIRKTYNGFKVAKSAVHVRDEVQGVYVVKNGLAAFREIDVLYSGEDYVIVAENNQKKNGILLYDEVILSADVKEGDVVR